MTGTYQHTCPCGGLITCEVDVGDHMVDIPGECDECGRPVSKQEQEEIYTRAMEDVTTSAIDRAHEDAKNQ